MRTLGMSLAGTTMVALVGGLGGVALAQDEEDPDPYPYVSGTLTYIDDVAEPSVNMAYGSEVIRDASATYELAMSDPRVTGTYSTLGASLDAHPNGVIAWMTPVRLDGDSGDSWSGTVSGTFHPEMGWQGTGWLGGDAGVFFLHMESPERDDGIWEIEGVIHDGYATVTDSEGDIVAETSVARDAAQGQ